MFDTSEFDTFGISHPMELGTWDMVTSSISVPSDSDQDSNFDAFIDKLFIDMNLDPAPIGFYDGGDVSQSEHADISGERNIGVEGTESETIENRLLSENLNEIENGVAGVELQEYNVVSRPRTRPSRPGEFVFALESPKKQYYPFLSRLDLQNRRRNKKPVEVGNNTYGRTGRRRCIACRRRKTKVLPIRNAYYI